MLSPSYAPTLGIHSHIVCFCICTAKSLHAEMQPIKVSTHVSTIRDMY